MLKLARTRPEDGPDSATMFYINRGNIEALKNEAEVYKRLGKHDGIIKFFQATEYTIELLFANQGDLQEYIQQKPQPSEEWRLSWMLSLVDTYAYIHSRRVLLLDLRPANVLIHNNQLKVADFGKSHLFPMDTNTEALRLPTFTLQQELCHVGCALYSISLWKIYDYEEFAFGRLYKEFPDIDGILGETIIRKCLTEGYTSMEALKKDADIVFKR